MALTPEQAAEVWDLFKDTPLWAKWPEIRRELTYRLTPRSVKAGEAVFRPDDPASHLYLIRTGTVLQTIRHRGQAWFRRELGPGQYFGQHSLFSGKHHTGAVAVTDSELYLMSAADLRAALERNPDLREDLLHEKRASRLRRVPLFELLSSEDVGWLALMMTEKTLERGAALDLVRERGLWIIDWGQMAVDGPAAFDRPGWRLTAGNFFFSPGVAPRLHTDATAAVAHIRTRLLYLDGEHFRRVAAAFPELAQMAARPVNIAGELERTRLLQGPGMTDAHFRDLAQYTAWNYVPAGQNISTQGTVGYSLVLVRKGSAVVTALDNEGRLRPQNFIRAGEAFGRTSLLQSRRRDATVRAVASADNAGARLAGTEVLDLDRRDLHSAFAAAPDLWHTGVWIYDQSEETREARSRYVWQEEGEVVAWSSRPHWLWLVGPLLTLLIIATVILVLLFAAGIASAPALGLESFLVLGLILIPVAGLFVINYYNDYYAISNRRVTRRDRRLLVWEERIDAPLEMVQDVTTDADFFGRLFDYGNVTIRTAAKVGAISFRNVPQPDFVKNLILQERAGAAAAMRGQHKEVLRRGLVDSLQLAQPVADPDQVRALGPDVRLPIRTRPVERVAGWLLYDRRQRPQYLPGAPRPQPAWVVRLTQPLPKRLQYVLVGPPLPPPKPVSGQIIWRKHWINLLQRAGTPMLVVVLLLLLIILSLGSMGDPLASARGGVVFALFALLIPAFLWFVWNYVDYRNDIYVVTDEKIIDLERKPLGLQTNRRESTLDRIQNVSSQQDGLLPNILNYGNVLIQTAAADAGFTFAMVGHPQSVQRTIFQKVDAYRRQQEEKALNQRQRELIEGIQVYHEMRRDREEGRI